MICTNFDTNKKFHENVIIKPRNCGKATNFYGFLLEIKYFHPLINHVSSSMNIATDLSGEETGFLQVVEINLG